MSLGFDLTGAAPRNSDGDLLAGGPSGVSLNFHGDVNLYMTVIRHESGTEMGPVTIEPACSESTGQLPVTHPANGEEMWLMRNHPSFLKYKRQLAAELEAVKAITESEPDDEDEDEPAEPTDEEEATKMGWFARRRQAKAAV